MASFPGIDNVEHEMVFRTMGGAGSKERIGAGFMHKKGYRWEHKDSYFPTYALVYLLRGKGIYVDAKGQHHELGPGSFFQRIPTLKHSNYVEPDSDYLECYVDMGKDLAEVLQRMRIITDDVVCGHIGLNQSLVEKFWDLKERLRDSTDDELPDRTIELLALVKDFLKHARIQLEGDEDAQMIEVACHFLSSHLNHRYNLREFCHRQGWGYERFRKLFVSRMGLSPNQYRIRRRLDVACQMLNDPANSVAHISYELGYPSPYEFSAQFKKHLGVSPSRFRRGQ